jgi:hypothetical protein
MKLAEIAKAIYGHLKRFESDPVINKEGEHGLTPYYCPNCWAAGSRIGVKYVSFQGGSTITKNEALAYLVWLNSGNVGKHWVALKEENAIAN